MSHENFNVPELLQNKFKYPFTTLKKPLCRSAAGDY